MAWQWHVMHSLSRLNPLKTIDLACMFNNTANTMSVNPWTKQTRASKKDKIAAQTTIPLSFQNESQDPI
jgi:hypothetical protein